MKIQTKAYGLGGIKNVHMVDFGAVKKVRFEVWEYENGRFGFPSMNEGCGRLKFTPIARQAVIDAIKASYVLKPAICS